MLTYVAMARANFGWLAWRRGDLALAKEEASAAWDFWQASKDTYPVQWAALWVLIAVSMSEETLSTAVDYARELFGPTQQLIPAELASVIEAGIMDFEAADIPATQQLFNQGLELARELRFL
jgi:hypothetical protein